MIFVANEFDMDMLVGAGWKDFELGFAKLTEQDENVLDASMETYLTGNVKQISLYFSSEEYETIIPRLDKVMEISGAKSHTEAFLEILKYYEDSHS